MINSNFFKIGLIILLLGAITFLMPVLSNFNGTGGIATVLSAVLSNLTNEERQIEKIPVLSENILLTEAAELKAQDMATLGYFAHTSPEGKTPWYWIEKVGYKYQYAGENLAVNFVDSEDVTNAWMASPSHRANIIKKKYTEMGTGIANGIYKGKEAIFVVQLYASPIKKSNIFEKISNSAIFY